MIQPTYDDLQSLPVHLPQKVPAAFEDVNGHLNIRHYVGIASEGLDEALADVGIPLQWPQTAGQGVFTAEHHMSYLKELLVGDRLSVRVRMIGRSERAAHVLVFLVDETHQQLSYVMEEIFLHVDMGSRRTTVWPDDVAEAMDKAIAEHEALAWEAPVSGAMSLR